MSRAFVYVMALAVAGALSGCASSPVAPPTVLVPTPMPCPAAADDKRPAAPKNTLSNLDASRPDAVARAYVASRIEWQGYAESLSQLLDACK